MSTVVQVSVSVCASIQSASISTTPAAKYVAFGNNSATFRDEVSASQRYREVRHDPEIFWLRFGTVSCDPRKSTREEEKKHRVCVLVIFVVTPCYLLSSAR